MPKPSLKLGKSPEELRQLEAEKQRKREEEIQRKNQEQIEKIEKMKRIQTRNKIIIISVVALLAITLIVFGTYNTFFKTPLTTQEVDNIVISRINYYPKESVRGYIVNNIDNLFNKYSSLDTKVYDYCKIDKDSVSITKIQTLSNTVAQVDFIADVEYKEKDTLVTDENLIKQLRKSGLKTDQDIIDEYIKENPTEKPTEKTTEAVTEKSTEVSTEATTPETNSTEDSTVSATMATENANDNKPEVSDDHSDVIPSPSPAKKTLKDVTANDVSTTTEASSETTATDITTEAETKETKEVTTKENKEEDTSDTETTDTTDIVDTDKSSITVSDSGGTKTQYYVYGNKIYQVGKKFIKTYSFTIPIEYFSEGNIRGYRIGDDMNLQCLNSADYTDFSNITVNQYYSFNNINKVDEKTAEAARIKVEKTLQDLYSGRDVSQDFVNNYTFNTYKAEFINIQSFNMYSGSNAVGFNAKVSYKIKLEDGLVYTVNAFLEIRQNGNTWIITKFM